MPSVDYGCFLLRGGVWGWSLTLYETLLLAFLLCVHVCFACCRRWALVYRLHPRVPDLWRARSKVERTDASRVNTLPVVISEAFNALGPEAGEKRARNKKVQNAKKASGSAVLDSIILFISVKLWGRVSQPTGAQRMPK